MVTKATFTLDEDTIATIRRLAARDHKPQSVVVREAVAHYAVTEQKTSPEERGQWLRTFDELIARVPPRSPKEVEGERRAIRQSRRQGWRGKKSR